MLNATASCRGWGNRHVCPEPARRQARVARGRADRIRDRGARRLRSDREPRLHRDSSAPQAAAAAGEFAFSEAGISDLSARMARGELSSRALTQAYLDRIAAIDDAGPTLNAVIELNPDALKEADARDAERKAGRVRSPCMASRCCSRTTSTPRRWSIPPARWRWPIIARGATPSSCAPARRGRGDPGQDQPQRVGQLPLDAFDLRLERARRANPQSRMCSIAAPAAPAPAPPARSPPAWQPPASAPKPTAASSAPPSVTGLVGLKPTVGLVSRNGIIPISSSQDTAGPMTRSVADAAFMLAAMVGRDEGDAVDRQQRRPRRVRLSACI